MRGTRLLFTRLSPPRLVRRQSGLLSVSLSTRSQALPVDYTIVPGRHGKTVDEMTVCLARFQSIRQLHAMTASELRSELESVGLYHGDPVGQDVLQRAVHNLRGKSAGASSWALDDADCLPAEGRFGALNGNAAAQCDLGFMFLHGKGVRRNPRTAAKWYRRAADQELA